MKAKIMTDKILVTGGCGYVGSSLVPSLLKHGYNIRVVDTQWFGRNLPEHNNLEVVKKDTREIKMQDLDGISKIIHLANIANDPAVDLDQVLSWEVNVLATHNLIDLATRQGNINQFIFASSGSVYGVKDEKNVTEDLQLVPISAYNKTKMVAERVIESYCASMKVHSVRPATVCGMSKRMRLDVAVNILTFQALEKGEISVFGGDQVRPNIHIEDMVAVYHHFLQNCDVLDSGAYNAGFENISIMDIARMVQEIIPCEIKVLGSSDPRSYRQCSDKLLASGFKPSKSVIHAIMDIKNSYVSGELVDCEHYHTIKTMKGLMA